jgi:hypothetical protein
MKELGSCDGGISGGHLISKSIIEFLKLDGDFVVSGLPWLEEGETKSLGPKNLVANCLCSKHNSAPKRLSLQAARFRPGYFKFNVETTTNQIDVTWDDGLLHGPIELTFLNKVQL